MLANKSLNRISFFLFLCFVLCLILFWVSNCVYSTFPLLFVKRLCCCMLV
jgi:hypothetical protein